MKKKMDQIIKSKKTTIVLSAVILIPILIFGGILVRDSLNKGKPVIGSRFDNELEHKITDEHLKQIDEKIAEDMILKKEVELRAATVRVNIEVSAELSKELMQQLGERVYASIDEIVPIETYFTNSENNKQYDLEINIHNDVEDWSTDDFVYLQIMRNGGMEKETYTFLTDAKNPEWKEEVLEGDKERAKKREEELKAETGETEEDESGEE